MRFPFSGSHTMRSPVKSPLFRGLFSAVILSLFSTLSGLIASEPDPTPAPVPVVFSIGDFLFTRPATWDWVIPSSAMRKVQLAVPDPDKGAGVKADVSFFYFGKDQGGTVQANIDRWAKQFSSPDGTPARATTESRVIGSTPVTFVSAAGSFTAGMLDGSESAQSHFALRGAILENQTGNVFVKMTGPKSLVDAASPIFDSMIAEACQAVAAK